MSAMGHRSGLRCGVLALSLLAGVAASAAQAETTTPDPAAAQPSIPQSIPGVGAHTLETMGGPDSGIGPPPRRHAAHGRRHHHYALRAPIERPALAGVELVAPLPRPPQPPHFTVPVPGYPLEDFVTAYTTPLTPVVCRPAPRDPDLPDPRLYREVPVVCAPDNP